MYMTTQCLQVYKVTLKKFLQNQRISRLGVTKVNTKCSRSNICRACSHSMKTYLPTSYYYKVHL